MKTLHIIVLLLAAAIIAACGDSYDKAQKLSKEKAAKDRHEDSLALKVGVVPTLDCLPIFVAKENGLFDSLKTDVRLKTFQSNIDCDAALAAGRIEGCVTDIVRGQYLKRRGTALDYVAATDAYWQMITNRKARIKTLKQLNDKMIAMTRYSATALLADYATDSAGLKRENVFKIQINDVRLRLQMLLNNEMDAMLLTEPYATTARLHKHNVLLDSRDKDMRFGVIAFNSKAMKDRRRGQQLKAFVEGYNKACDIINKNGVRHYAALLKKYYKADDKTIAALPEMKFKHAAAPRQKDIETADKWLKNTD